MSSIASPLFFAFVVLLLVTGGLVVVVIRLHKRLSVFMKGKNGATLESTMQWLTQKHAEVDDTLHAHKEALEMIDRRVKKSVRGYSLVRYDAYEDTGGNQSFASGFIDEHGDGYILSVITNRSHVGVYAKPVARGTALATLTEQEHQALTEAQKNLSH